MNTRILLLTGLSALLAGLVLACGGGSAGTNPPSNPNVINGISVPPDPGAAGLATVAGIDTDANGIRDDIDRFIATRYGTNATALSAARQSARARQTLLTTHSTDHTAARIALQDSSDAGSCAGRALRTVNLNSTDELREIYLRTYNTPERLAQYKSVVAAAGPFTRSYTSVVCP